MQCPQRAARVAQADPISDRRRAAEHDRNEPKPTAIERVDFAPAARQVLFWAAQSLPLSHASTPLPQHLEAAVGANRSIATPKDVATLRALVDEVFARGRLHT